MTNRELFNTLYAAASRVYDDREARSAAWFVAEKLYGAGRTAIALEPDRDVYAADLESVLIEISAGRPVQYITGTCDFCGMEFAVGEGVLIPRGETEELVEWVASEIAADTAILDVGTGSGAIAVSLAKKLPDSEIYAVDVSPEALAAARRNAETNNVRVAFARLDILDADCELPWPDARFDVIVSNPPYIPAADLTAMHINVTDYEPHEALFVPDADPLVFYRAIALTGQRLLKPRGRLYFEIYEHAAEEVSKMLDGAEYVGVEVRKDIHGRDRMIKCVKI